MSLLHQIAGAALDATAAQLAGPSPQADAAAVPNSSSSSGAATSTVAALLQQLTSSIADIHAQHKQQQQQPGRAKAARSKQGGVADGAAQHGVQAGLQATNQQLQRLLAQHSGVLSGSSAAAAAGQPPCTQAQTSTTPSRAVLQSLLQLAVGDSCCSSSARPDPGHNSSSGSSSSTHSQQLLLLAQQGLAPQALSGQQRRQQQEWVRAASEAVQLFSLQELEQLPTHSMLQALLLQPGLLDHLLEAAAAAVLQPLLQPLLPAAHTTPAAVSTVPGGSSGSCSGSINNMQGLLAASCPWMHSLAGVLAHNPLLLLRASSTLLGWFEASGHARLWQLLSTTCRPAWQQLAAAAAAPQHTTPRQPHNITSSLGSFRQQSSQQAVLAGSLQLLCPQPWQQQLVCLLAQEPSVQGLLWLLQQLPGLAALQQHQGAAEGDAVCGVRAGGAGGSSSKADSGRVSPWSDEALLAWPDVQEWCQPADLQSGPAGNQDASQVMLAWGLVMQHHCWYQFACTLLVTSSLQQQQQQQQQQASSQSQRQQQQQQQDCTSALLQLQQLLQQASQPALQQQAQHLSISQLAGCAAAVIAWVHQPTNSDRQRHLTCQLLQASSVPVGGSDVQQQQQQQGGALQLAGHLLRSWRASLSQNSQQQQQQQQQSCNTAWVSPALCEVDLLCGVLRQKQLLLDCTPEQLVSLCSASAAAATVSHAGSSDGVDAEQHMQPAGTSAPACRLLPAALASQLLDCSNDLCAAAMEVVNLSMRRRLSQQQQHLGHSSSAASQSGVSGGVSWLAQQWLLAADSPAGSASGRIAQGAGGQQGIVVPDLAAAKQLLAAATGLDQHLKQCAGHVVHSSV